MYGARPQSAAEIEALWRLRSERGFEMRGLATDLLETGETIPAYVNIGRWVAECPGCNGGIACWPDHPRGCCLDCGRVYKIRFPAKRSRERAEKLLLARSQLNRNWHPHQRESVSELAAENEILLDAEESK